MKQTKKKKRMKPVPMIPAAQGLHATAEPRDMVLNTQVRDSSSKTIFDNHILYSQFLRDYVNLDTPFFLVSLIEHKNRPKHLLQKSRNNFKGNSRGCKNRQKHWKKTA